VWHLVCGVGKPTCDNDAISALESVIDNDSDLLDKLPQPFTNLAKDRSANTPYADLPPVVSASTFNYLPIYVPTHCYCCTIRRRFVHHLISNADRLGDQL
jgi:hypothetical protein